MTGKKRISVDSALRRFAISVRLPKTRAEEQSKKSKGKRNDDGAKQDIEALENLANIADGHENVRSKASGSGGAKSSKSKTSQTTSTNRHGGRPPTSGSNTELMDKGLVVFDVSSPIPLSVHRLPNDNRVLTTSFVALPQKSSTSHESVCPLVYIDSNLELHVIANDLDSAALSAVTAVDHGEANEMREPDSVTRLGELLGPDWRDKAQERAGNVAATTAGAPGVKTSLSKSFAGATHTQAPLAKSAMAAISSLLHEIRLADEANAECSKSDDAVKIAALANESWDGQIVGDGVDARLMQRTPPVRSLALTSVAGRVERMSRWASLAEDSQHA